MPATQATAVIRPPGERRSRIVMMIWIGTTALPMASGMSVTTRSDIEPPSRYGRERARRRYCDAIAARRSPSRTCSSVAGRARAAW